MSQSNQWEIATYGNPLPGTYYFSIYAPRPGSITAFDYLLAAAGGANYTMTVQVVSNGNASAVSGLANVLINSNSSVVRGRVAATGSNTFNVGDIVQVSLAGVVGDFTTSIMHLEVQM